MPASKVYTASDPINAEIIKDFLGGHGIDANVRGRFLWGGMGELPADVYPTVWVSDAADHDEARRLIARFESGATERARPWRCGGCGERLDGQFDACWRCGTTRDK